MEGEGVGNLTTWSITQKAYIVTPPLSHSRDWSWILC